MNLKFNNDIECRVILRESIDGSVKVVETIDGDYAVIENKNVVGIYQNKTDAYRSFGRLTRKEEWVRIPIIYFCLECGKENELKDLKQKPIEEYEREELLCKYTEYECSCGETRFSIIEY
jgi:DNA-directed RNA polymerase subunit RPC12/RpoP